MLLFLEGTSRTGKSTLLRECLLPYKEQLGGFSSQRLWEKDFCRCYRMTPASDFQLDQEYHPDFPHIFRYHRHQYPEVFKTYGVQLLEDASHYPLILLDEIGGAELLVPEFRQTLYKILSGNVPCIGVLKEASKAQFMKSTVDYGKDVIFYNEELRDFLQQLPNCRFLHFERNHRDSLKKEINQFLERIFCTCTLTL